MPYKSAAGAVRGYAIINLSADITEAFMRRYSAILAAAAVCLFAAAAPAAQHADFDQGADLSLIWRAGDAGYPTPEIPLADFDRPVWISIARPDVAALESDLFKRAPAAQNDKLFIYELRTSELDQVSEGMERRFRRSPGFFAHDSLASAMSDLAGPAPAPAGTYTIDQADKVKAMLKPVKESSIAAAIERLSSYKNRYYRSAAGISAAKELAVRWTALAAGRSDISVTNFQHAAFPQESVILTVRGTAEPDKIVVVGGHIDSTAGGADSPAPGADDNASGIATAEEVIRALVASGYKPARTVKFIAFAAEEAGLRGSGEIAAAFKKEGLAVQGMLNLDMTGYKGSPQDIYFVADNTSADQNAFLVKLISVYTDYTSGTLKCGYGCSDHASWTKNGFAASTPFESTMSEYNPSIHTANDTLAQMGGSAAHSVKFAKLAAAYVVEMAK